MNQVKLSYQDALALYAGFNAFFSCEPQDDERYHAQRLDGPKNEAYAELCRIANAIGPAVIRVQRFEAELQKKFFVPLREHLEKIDGDFEDNLKSFLKDHRLPDNQDIDGLTVLDKKFEAAYNAARSFLFSDKPFVIIEQGIELLPENLPILPTQLLRALYKFIKKVPITFDEELFVIPDVV
jgi:hypothetical protein